MIQPKNKEELRAAITERIETKAEYCDFEPDFIILKPDSTLQLSGVNLILFTMM